MMLLPSMRLKLTAIILKDFTILKNKNGKLLNLNLLPVEKLFLYIHDYLGSPWEHRHNE